jgi:hypothetical protein
MSNDLRLRRHGFRICARPRTGINLWERGGRKYTEAEAVKVMEREQDQKKKLKGGL